MSKRLFITAATALLVSLGLAGAALAGPLDQYGIRVGDNKVSDTPAQIQAAGKAVAVSVQRLVDGVLGPKEVQPGVRLPGVDNPMELPGVPPMPPIGPNVIPGGDDWMPLDGVPPLPPIGPNVVPGGDDIQAIVDGLATGKLPESANINGLRHRLGV